MFQDNERNDRFNTMNNSFPSDMFVLPLQRNKRSFQWKECCNTMNDRFKTTNITIIYPKEWNGTIVLTQQNGTIISTQRNDLFNTTERKGSQTASERKLNRI